MVSAYCPIDFKTPIPVNTLCVWLLNVDNIENASALVLGFPKISLSKATTVSEPIMYALSTFFEIALDFCDDNCFQLMDRRLIQFRQYCSATRINQFG